VLPTLRLPGVNVAVPPTFYLAKLHSSPLGYAREILDRAVEAERDLYKGWTSGTVARRLRDYSIPSPVKTGSRREYRGGLDKLREIQTNFELGFPAGTGV